MSGIRKYPLFWWTVVAMLVCGALTLSTPVPGFYVVPLVFALFLGWIFQMFQPMRIFSAELPLPPRVAALALVCAGGDCVFLLTFPYRIVNEGNYVTLAEAFGQSDLSQGSLSFFSAIAWGAVLMTVVAGFANWKVSRQTRRELRRSWQRW